MDTFIQLPHSYSPYHLSKPTIPGIIITCAPTSQEFEYPKNA
jgi:hypothetical protein